MGAPYHNISPVINTAPQAWIDQQTLRGIGSNRSRIYVDSNGDLWGQFENNAPKKIAGLGGTSAASAVEVPVGAVFQWIGSVAPDGYILCDGQSASGFPKLSALLSSFGGRTPDLRGRVTVGSGALPSGRQNFPGPLSLGAVGGDSVIELDLEQMPPHIHDLSIEDVTITPSQHQHDVDVPAHAHSVIANVSAHGHNFDIDGFTGDALVTQDASAADWAPSVGDDTNPTWTNTALETGDETWAGTPAVVTGGPTTTGDGGAIDFTTVDGGYHDHLTTKDDSAVADGDPDAYSGDGGIDVGNTNDGDDYGSMTMSWDSKPEFTTDSNSTTGAADYTATPAAASAGAIDINTGNAGAIDFTTDDGGYHDHLTTKDDSAVADGDPDAYSGDGGIDVGNTNDGDDYGSMTMSWDSKPEFTTDSTSTTGAADYPVTPAAAGGGAIDINTGNAGAIDFTTDDGGYHDHLTTKDDSAVADGDPDAYSGDGGIDVGNTNDNDDYGSMTTSWDAKPEFTTDSTSTTGAADYTATPVAMTGGAIDTNVGLGGAIDATTTNAGGFDIATDDGGYHDHLTTKDDSAVADGDPDSYSGDGGIDVGNTNDNDSHGNMTMSWDAKPTASATASYTGAAKSEDSGSYTTWAPTIDASVSSDDTDDSLYTSATFAAGDGIHSHTLAVGLAGGHSHTATSTSSSSSTSTSTSTVTENLAVNPAAHNHAAGTLDAAYVVSLETYGIEAQSDDNYNQWYPVPLADDGINDWAADNLSTDIIQGSTANTSLGLSGSVGVDTSTSTTTTTTTATTLSSVAGHAHTGSTTTADTADAAVRGGHTHAFGPEAGEGDITVVIDNHALTEPDHVHPIDGLTLDTSGWNHTHEFDIPFTRGTHSHDVDVSDHNHGVDVAAHQHAIDIVGHGHALANLAHTHDFASVAVNSDTEGWEHSHEFDIPFTRGTHAHDIDIAAHLHSVDVAAHGHALTNLAHTHDFASVAVNSDTEGWEHSHEFDIPFTRGTHAHDIDVEAHLHSVDVAAHGHALTNLDHTHDFANVTVGSDTEGWEHSHEFDIPFTRGTHAHDIDVSGHNHTIAQHGHSLSALDHTHEVPTANFDHGHTMDETESFHVHQIDLDSETAVAEQPSQSVNFTQWGGGSFAGNSGLGGSEAFTHTHEGRTNEVGGREALLGNEVDPVDICPPYIAMNYIIKHD